MSVAKTAMEVPIDARELVDLIVQTALDRKATDPAVLAVADLVGYADYFVIVSARNARQVRAIADAVRQELKNEHEMFPVGVEGMESCKWVLVDYDDVVLHVFQEGTRAFYDLEGLWSEAPRMPVPEVEQSRPEVPQFTLP